MGEWELIEGEALAELRGMPTASVDAVVTDPPAGIAFMGKEWDSFGRNGNPNAETDRAAGKGRGPVCHRNPHGKSTQPFGYSRSGSPSAEGRDAFLDFLTPILAECRRIARPGAYILCWALPRTSHWTGTAIEDAGWTVRDRITHLFGTGFPKGAACLKPAAEDWWLAKAPGKLRALNVDGCRVPVTAGDYDHPGGRPGGRSPGNGGTMGDSWHDTLTQRPPHDEGRYPANVTLSYPEDEYILKSSATEEQKRELFRWLYEDSQQRVHRLQETAVPPALRTAEDEVRGMPGAPRRGEADGRADGTPTGGIGEGPGEGNQPPDGLQAQGLIEGEVRRLQQGILGGAPGVGDGEGCEEEGAASPELEGRAEAAEPVGPGDDGIREVGGRREGEGRGVRGLRIDSGDRGRSRRRTGRSAGATRDQESG